MKRFYLTFESDRKVCGDNEHHYGNASTLKTAKVYIELCKKMFAEDKPRHFKIWDTWSEGEKAELVYYQEN